MSGIAGDWLFINDYGKSMNFKLFNLMGSENHRMMKKDIKNLNSIMDEFKHSIRIEVPNRHGWPSVFIVYLFLIEYSELNEPFYTLLLSQIDASSVIDFCDKLSGILRNSYIKNKIIYRAILNSNCVNYCLYELEHICLFEDEA